MSAQPVKIQKSQSDFLMNVFHIVSTNGKDAQKPIIIDAVSNETIFRTTGK